MAEWTFEIDGEIHRVPYDLDFSTLSPSEIDMATKLANNAGPIPAVAALLYVKALQQVPALDGLWTPFLSAVGPMLQGDPSIVKVEGHG